MCDLFLLFFLGGGQIVVSEQSQGSSTTIGGVFAYSGKEFGGPGEPGHERGSGHDYLHLEGGADFQS